MIGSSVDHNKTPYPSFEQEERNNETIINKKKWRKTGEREFLHKLFLADKFYSLL
jgi:hypothetical protein